jgi:hypothetical protein
MYFLSTPCFSSASTTLECSTLSDAFAKSTNATYSSRRYSVDFSRIWFTVCRWSIVEKPPLNRTCPGGWFLASRTTVTNQICIYKEIRNQLYLENDGQCSVTNLIYLCPLYKNKDEIFDTILRVLSYELRTPPNVLSEENGCVD